MASLDPRLVGKELKALVKVSQSIKKLTWEVLARIESDPSSFACMEDVPVSLRDVPGLTLRKAKITNKKRDFRIIVAHWILEDSGKEHVDLLLLFKRRDGYDIDWD